MKKLLIILSLVVLMQSNKLCAQITLDTTIMPLDGWGFDVYPIQISKTETKYLFADTVTNTFSLYNMDFTPFLLNVAVPEPFLQSGYWYFQVLYVSRTLFDCDSTNIEYVYESSLGDNNQPFYIMRTDGTQLFKLDSAVGLYALGGVLSLSEILSPIMNTSAGTKMYLYRPGGNGQLVNIYSLCGTLPEDVFDYTNSNQSFLQLFPNPTSGTLTFQINLPDNINDYELTIVDNNAREVIRQKINFGNNKYTIDVKNFSSGTYFYSLSAAKGKAYKGGKFILNK